MQRYLFPLVGMTLFWGYFRYQSFFEALYPPESVVRAGGLQMQSHAVFLLVLSLMTAVLIGGVRRGGGRFGTLGPSVVAAGSFAGTAGVLVALASGPTPGVLALVLSCALVAFGFLTGYLAWAEHFSSGFSATDVVLLAGSFALSLTVCVGLTRAVGTVFRLSLAIATPVGTGLAWCASERRPVRAGAPLGASLRGMPSFVALFLAFLVFGAVVRGVVDAGAAGLGMRWPVSVALALLLFAACAALWAFGRVRGRAAGAGGCAADHVAVEPGDEATWIMAERICLGSWVVLAALLCLGVVWGLAAGSYAEAGQLVVVARSTLDFVMWVMLCSVASRPGVGVRPIFLVFGMLTQIVSWALSYAIVPAALAALEPRAGASAADALVLCSLMALMVALVVALGTLYLRGRRADLGGRARRAGAGAREAQGAGETPARPDGAGRAQAPAAGESPAAGGSLAADQPLGGDAAAAVEEHVGAYLATTYTLSPREVQVVLQFSQGHSIKHIASDLGISAGTVQSHIKGAYRKLDVHSRDELKGLLGCLADFARREG